ncbi:HAD-IA family hydrolase [Longimicrobium sp.]|uniref:HAD-IA family hydrolase n=1 Tax=Longimicrobium sp. TaxID=2029185 RepID=UPI002E33EC6A|nr:HAD-IA family hydrolase [Longimicrobium sp.]HEX6038714.1 HAD-IA family hydrolase [Longimicrobium sp.]
MQKGSIRAVLYDFDGTLADSTELIMRCYRHTMAAHLGHVPPDEEWLSGFGMTLETQLRRFARDAAEAERMLDTYRDYQNSIHDELLRPFPGAVETVAELDRRGYRLAIVTSKHRRSAMRGMELCGLVSHFDVIVTPEDVREPKPHPEPVLFALEKLGMTPGEALFIGDSPHDVASGKAAGTRTAGALWGPFPREALETAGPDALLNAQHDVLRLLDGA